MSTTAVDFEEKPDRGTVLLTAVAGLVAVTATAVAPTAALVGLVGISVMVVGVNLPSRAVLTIGTMGLFAAVILAALAGASPELAVIGAAATVVAWDAAENGISLGQQLGRAAETTRPAIVHLVATVVVAVVVGVVVVVTFRLARRGQPTLASLLLLFAAVLFIWLLDR